MGSDMGLDIQATVGPDQCGFPLEQMESFRAGLAIGERRERRRILAALDAAVVTCCVDGGTAEDRARAGALAAVRRMVMEGGS